MPFQRFTGSSKNYKTDYKGPTRAAINRSEQRGWVDVHTPFNSDFVKKLKDNIQPSHRKWNPQQGVWHVNELFLDVVVELTKHYFDEVTTDLLNEEPTQLPANMFLPVMQALPKDTVDKVYKALAVAIHPDHGGSNELMSQLNQAYQSVKG
jgi:hypothetical protein